MTRCAILLVLLALTANASAQQVEMTILSDAGAVNRYPGNDGLVGTADDVVSSDPTPGQQSDPNINGSYGLNAFNFGGDTSDAELPTGFNAITFVDGNVTVDQGVLNNGGGPIISALNITSGTEPFPGHGAYTATATAINSGTYDTTTGDFTLDLDISFLINGNTSTEPGLVLTGTAMLVPSAQFGATGSSYIDSVLSPLAQNAGATSLAFFDGTGTLPNLGFPIRFVIAAIEGGSTGFVINQGISGGWFEPETAGQGFLIDIEPSTSFIFIAWFTYEEAAGKAVGSPDQRWLTAQGNYSGGSANLPLLVTSGGVFDSPEAPGIVQDGTLDISFSSCSSGTVNYNVPSSGISGSVAIQRLLPDSANLCETLSNPGQ